MKKGWRDCAGKLKTPFIVVELIDSLRKKLKSKIMNAL